MTMTGACAALLEDASVPKRVHDLKGTLRALEQQGVQLAGANDDLMLYSYLVNPTHATPPAGGCGGAVYQPSAAADGRSAAGGGGACDSRACVRCCATTSMRSMTRRVYEEIDLPLVPMLLQMETVGVRIDSGVLNLMGEQLSSEMQRVGEADLREAGHRFNINSPKQLGDVLFNKMDLPKPLKYGKGKVVSTAQDVLEELAAHHDVPKLVHRVPLAGEAEIELCRLAAAARRPRRPRAYDVQPGGHGDGQAVVDQSESAEYSGKDGAGARDSRGVHRRARASAALGGLFADRVAAASRTSPKIRCC